MRIGGDASLATSLSHAPGVRMPRVVRPFEEQMHIFRKYKAAASDERQLTVMKQRAESQLGATRAAKIELEARQEETELHNAEAAAALAAERQKLEEEQDVLATAQHVYTRLRSDWSEWHALSTRNVFERAKRTYMPH